ERTSRSMAPQSGPVAPTSAAGRGPAVRVTVSPVASPMRFIPKSKARIVWITPSGMAGDAADDVLVDAEEAPRGAPALLVGQLEHDAGIYRHLHPGILLDLVLELARLPAGVAERDERILPALAARHGGEHIARGGDLHGVGNLVRVVPLAARTVEDEDAIGVHRAAAEHRLRADRLG